MGNPNENIEHAIRYFDMSAEEEARAYKIAGILAGVLLAGVVASVVTVFVLLVLALV